MANRTPNEFGIRQKKTNRIPAATDIRPLTHNNTNSIIMVRNQKIQNMKLTYALAAGLLFISNCSEKAGTPFTNSAGKEPVLIVEYQEVMYRSSTQWPEDFKASPDPKKGIPSVQNTENVWFMEDYSHIQETQIIDEDGYLSYEKIYLNGDGEMGMPAEMMEEAKPQMPYSDRWANPLVKTTFKDGKLTNWAKDGSILNSYDFPKDQFKVNPDSLAPIDSTDFSGSFYKLQSSLAGNDVTLKTLSPNLAQLDFEIEGNERVQQVVNLKYNQVTYSRSFNEAGKPVEESFFKYEIANGYPVMSVEDTREFGSLENGEWGMVSRTVRNRKNIHVTWNK